MSTTVSFRVDMKPLGWQRPGGTFKRYNQKQTRDAETLIALEYRTQCRNTYFMGPVHIYIEAGYPIPKSASVKTADLMRHGKIEPTVKADYDNIAKLIGDALNQVAYHDDAQITYAVVKKVYTDLPYIYVILKGETK